MPRIVEPQRHEEDTDLELSLRPTTFDDFVGQPKTKEQLSIFLQAARNRGEALDHVLLYGPPGLGKTTLAHLWRARWAQTFGSQPDLSWSGRPIWPDC